MLRAFIENTKLGVKLPMVMGLLAVLTISILSTFSAVKTAWIITESATEKLESIALLKSKRVRGLLDAIDRDLRLQAAAPSTSVALIALADGFNALDNPSEVLRRVYIDENEHPIGEKDKLVKADTGSSYGFIHAIYHPTFDALQNEMGYYDVFLFDLQGNLVYSVFKENDFATNMRDGPWAETGLAEAFRQAVTLDAGANSAFVDFARYAPSNDAPAAFIARPVFNEQGTMLGVLAFQMPVQQLNNAAGDLEGLGTTADGFLVGADFLMRTDSPQTESDDTLVTKVEHDGVLAGLSGERGVFEATGHAGQRVMGYAAPIEFLGKRWVTIVQQNHGELFSGLRSALLNTALVATVILAGVLAVSVSFSRSIARPVKDLADAVNCVAEGATDTVVPCTDRGDEIGDLARRTEIFRQNALKIEKMVEEQEEASAKMKTLNKQREEASQREKDMALEKEKADVEAREMREEMMRKLGASFGKVVGAAVEGDFSARIHDSFDDEILNSLSQDINDLMGTFEDGLSRTGDALERVASGDLTHRMTGQFKGAFAQLQSNVNNMLDALTTLISDISESGATLSGSASELRQTADVLSRQAEQNAASVEQTSAALEELTASMSQVDSNLASVSLNAQEAKTTAGESERVATEAAMSMDRISKGSQEINRVTEVINDIAFQINLLALNAGVEAARAGDAGRGFSVVASEVRQLAQRAGEAAKEIAQVLSESDAAVQEGVANVSNAKTSLDEISRKVISISESIEDVTRAISEQASGIKEISSAVSQVDNNTQKQAAAFEEVTASSHLLASEAEALRESTSKFRISGEENRPQQTDIPSKATKIALHPMAQAAAVEAKSFDRWDEF